MTTKTKNKSWYEIKAQDNAAHITIHGVIGDWGVSSEDFEEELKAIPVNSDAVLHIHSDGGSVIEGYAIYIMLKRHFKQITTVVDGIAASMGSYLFMLGSKRVIPANGWLMIHSPKGGRHGSPEENEAFTKFLYEIKNEMVSIYAGGSNLSEDEVIEMMKVDTWIRGDKAVEMGLATELEAEVDIAAQLQIPLSGFKNVPDAIEALNDKSSDKSSEIAVTLNLDTAGANLALDNIENRISNLSAVAGTNQLEGIMPNKENPVVEPTAAIDDAVKAALALEETRKSEILGAFGEFAKDHGELLNGCLLDSKVTVADAQAKLLKAMGEGVTPVSTPSATVEVLASGSERFQKDAEEALMARAGKGKADSANPLRGKRLDAIAQKSLEIAGVSTGGMDSRKLVAAAFTQTGSDFPVLLENTMHKVLQNAYATQDDTWSRFCSVGSVSDFRAHNRYRTGSFGSLDSVNEAGEFKNKTIPDGEKSTITAGTKGNIVNITREAIINDDLGAFVNMAADLGRSARLTIEKDVYALLALNGGLGPTMADGNSLFHASRNNIGNGAAISMAALDADAALMAYQMDVSNNEVLDLSPSVLLVARTLYGTAKGINDAPFDPDTTGKLQKPNIVSGLFNDIVGTARLTGTRRYMFADPNLAPVIEVAFLNGEQSPFLDTQDGFTVDGVKWKVRLDYGVAGIDYRGAMTDAGA